MGDVYSLVSGLEQDSDMRFSAQGPVSMDVFKFYNNFSILRIAHAQKRKMCFLRFSLYWRHHLTFRHQILPNYRSWCKATFCNWLFCCSAYRFCARWRQKRKNSKTYNSVNMGPIWKIPNAKTISLSNSFKWWPWIWPWPSNDLVKVKNVFCH